MTKFLKILILLSFIITTNQQTIFGIENNFNNQYLALYTKMDGDLSNIISSIIKINTEYKIKKINILKTNSSIEYEIDEHKKIIQKFKRKDLGYELEDTYLIIDLKNTEDVIFKIDWIIQRLTALLYTKDLQNKTYEEKLKLARQKNQQTEDLVFVESFMKIFKKYFRGTATLEEQKIFEEHKINFFKKLSYLSLLLTNEDVIKTSIKIIEKKLKKRRKTVFIQKDKLLGGMRRSGYYSDSDDEYDGYDYDDRHHEIIHEIEYYTDFGQGPFYSLQEFLSKKEEEKTKLNDIDFLLAHISNERAMSQFLLLYPTLEETKKEYVLKSLLKLGKHKILIIMEANNIIHKEEIKKILFEKLNEPDLKENMKALIMLINLKIELYEKKDEILTIISKALEIKKASLHTSFLSLLNLLLTQLTDKTKEIIELLIKECSSTYATKESFKILMNTIERLDDKDKNDILTKALTDLQSTDLKRKDLAIKILRRLYPNFPNRRDEIATALVEAFKNITENTKSTYSSTASSIKLNLAEILSDLTEVLGDKKKEVIKGLLACINPAIYHIFLIEHQTIFDILKKFGLENLNLEQLIPLLPANGIGKEIIELILNKIKTSDDKTTILKFLIDELKNKNIEIVTKLFIILDKIEIQDLGILQYNIVEKLLSNCIDKSLYNINTQAIMIKFIKTLPLEEKQKIISILITNLNSTNDTILNNSIKILLALQEDLTSQKKDLITKLLYRVQNSRGNSSIILEALDKLYNEWEYKKYEVRAILLSLLDTSYCHSNLYNILKKIGLEDLTISELIKLAKIYDLRQTIINILKEKTKTYYLREEIINILLDGVKDYMHRSNKSFSIELLKDLAIYLQTRHTEIINELITSFPKPGDGNTREATMSILINIAKNTDYPNKKLIISWLIENLNKRDTDTKSRSAITLAELTYMLSQAEMENIIRNITTSFKQGFRINESPIKTSFIILLSKIIPKLQTPNEAVLQILISNLHELDTKNILNCLSSINSTNILKMLFKETSTNRNIIEILAKLLTYEQIQLIDNFIDELSLEANAKTELKKKILIYRLRYILDITPRLEIQTSSLANKTSHTFYFTAKEYLIKSKENIAILNEIILSQDILFKLMSSLTMKDLFRLAQTNKIMLFQTREFLILEAYELLNQIKAIEKHTPIPANPTYAEQLYYFLIQGSSDTHSLNSKIIKIKKLVNFDEDKDVILSTRKEDDSIFQICTKILSNGMVIKQKIYKKNLEVFSTEILKAPIKKAFTLEPIILSTISIAIKQTLKILNISNIDIIRKSLKIISVIFDRKIISTLLKPKIISKISFAV